MVVIKFSNGTYYAGCANHHYFAKTLAGAKVYRSAKVAENVIKNSTNFYTPSDGREYEIVEVELREKTDER